MLKSFLNNYYLLKEMELLSIKTILNKHVSACPITSINKFQPHKCGKMPLGLLRSFIHGSIQSKSDLPIRKDKKEEI